ncbi:MAG: hypothetical protein WAM62_01515 [Pseudolabrys sp.]
MGAPQRNTDFIGTLCVALCHEWKPRELFVIFTAYFDEADTHGSAPTVIMGAFLAHAYEWRIFNRDLNRIRKDYGFSVFHAKDFKAKNGEFRGWDDAKCIRLINDLTTLVKTDLTEGATVHLERARYLGEYRNQPFPAKMQPDSQFGLCFRALLAHLIGTVAAIGKAPVLHIVVEDGHENVGASRTIFNEFKTRLRRHGVNLLGDITIAEKATTDELMVADFLAHTYSLMRASTANGELDYRDIAPEPPQNEASLTFLEFTPEAFANSKLLFERDKQEKQDEWRKQRDARRASSGKRPS